MTDLQIKAMQAAETARSNRENEYIKLQQAEVARRQAAVSEHLMKQERFKTLLQVLAEPLELNLKGSQIWKNVAGGLKDAAGSISSLSGALGK